METVWEFSAYNSEKLYGYGSEPEARLYLDWLNKNREINQYEMSVSLDKNTEALAFSLAESIAEID